MQRENLLKYEGKQIWQGRIKENEQTKQKNYTYLEDYIKKSKAVVYCELHKCYLEPRDITEKKCNFKRCKHKIEL